MKLVLNIFVKWFIVFMSYGYMTKSIIIYNDIDFMGLSE